MGERSLEPVEAKELAKQRLNARLAGNPEFDLEANWYDETVLDALDGNGLDEWIYEIAELVDFRHDIINLGLRGTIDPAKDPELAGKFLEARTLFRQILKDTDKANLVEPFEPGTYTMQATLGENLLFGQADEDQFNEKNLAENHEIRDILRKTDLDMTLYEMGREIASTTIDLFKDLSPTNPFFDQLNFMTADELPEFANAIARTAPQSFTDVSENDKAMFMGLTFEYIEPRYRFGLLDEELKKNHSGSSRPDERTAWR